MSDTTERAPRDGRPTFEADSTLTLQEIADTIGRHPSTIKRWKDAGRWSGAFQDTTGRRTWRVPVTDLVTSGDLDAGQVSVVQSHLAGVRESKAVRELRERVLRLEGQLETMTQLANERASMIQILSSSRLGARS